MGPGHWERSFAEDGDVERQPGPLWAMTLNSNGAGSSYRALSLASDDKYDILALQETRMGPRQMAQWIALAARYGYSAWGVPGHEVVSVNGQRAFHGGVVIAVKDTLPAFLLRTLSLPSGEFVELGDYRAALLAAYEDGVLAPTRWRARRTIDYLVLVGLDAYGAGFADQAPFDVQYSWAFALEEVFSDHRAIGFLLNAFFSLVALLLVRPRCRLRIGKLSWLSSMGTGLNFRMCR